MFTPKIHEILFSKFEHVIIGLEHFINFRFLRVYIRNTKNFVLKIWEIVGKIKTDEDRQLLVLKMIKSSVLVKFIGNFFYHKS